MRCPNCDNNLSVREQSGIEIDYCPGCRGVWLDRGELDKFIERAGREATHVSPVPCIRSPHHGSAPYLTLQGFEERSYSKEGLEKNRELFLNKLFDFE